MCWVSLTHTSPRLLRSDVDAETTATIAKLLQRDAEEASGPAAACVASLQRGCQLCICSNCPFTTKTPRGVQQAMVLGLDYSPLGKRGKESDAEDDVSASLCCCGAIFSCSVRRPPDLQHARAGLPTLSRC